jgi:hypothetical protein
LARRGARKHLRSGSTGRRWAASGLRSETVNVRVRTGAARPFPRRSSFAPGAAAGRWDVDRGAALRRALASSSAQLLDWIQKGSELAPFPNNLVARRAASHDFEAHPVGVCEERGVVVLGILGIERRWRGLDAEGDKGKVSFIDGLAIEGLQAEVVQPGRVRVVWHRRASWSDRDLECAIEVVRVPLACDGTVTLEETERPHHAIVEGLGPIEIGDDEVNMVEAYDRHKWQTARLARLSNPAWSGAM